MTPFDATQGVQQAYNFWLGLLPQFLSQFNGANPGKATSADGKTNANAAAAWLNDLTFPADQIAQSTAITQQLLQSFAQTLAPMLQGGALSNLLGPWASAVPGFGSVASVTSGKPGEAAATSTAQAFFAPWAALMPNLQESAAPGGSVLPLQAMNQAWVDWGSKLAGATPAQLHTAFERTYGGFSDALGLGSVREMYAAWQDMLGAGTAHQEARANYSVLVQRAFTQGVQRLTTRLAEKAAKGERIDSVLALLRLWAYSTEEVMQETLMSAAGLAATAALTRSASTYRKRMQQVSAVLAEGFDLATRRELDEAYREIQNLKRELRALRPARGPNAAAQQAGSAKTARAANDKKRKGET